MRKIKGFTLVELLAVIVILAVILVIAVPKIIGVIDSARIGSLESTAKLIAKSAERVYTEKEILGEEVGEIDCNDIVQISNEDYSSCNIKFINGKAYVTIEGSGKFLGKYVNNGTKELANIVEYPSTNLATTVLINSNELIPDETVDKNLRYSGYDNTEIVDDMNNYVTFNNEIWRIIGIFNVSNGEKTEQRIKLIREESIGNYSWDSSETAVYTGYGVNNWVESDLNTLLNDYYYNGKDNQTCYIGRYAEKEEAKTICSFSSVVLDTTSKNLIDNTVWNLGGNGNHSNTLLPTLAQYVAERGSAVKIAGTPTIYTAKIGLPFPSDYGYASTDTDCRTNLRSGEKCKNNNWLHTEANYWTISHHSGTSSRLFYVLTGGGVNHYYACKAYGVRPVIYLKSDVKIMSGTGSSENPYQLSL